jgi:hypothetical protein
MSYLKLFTAASSGNRTRAARVAGEHSTTEPTMLFCLSCTSLGLTASAKPPALSSSSWIYSN